MMAVELPREEVALLFGTLTACGFLILGVLEIMWPAARRSNPTHSARPPASRLTRTAQRAAPTVVAPVTSPPGPTTLAPRPVATPPVAVLAPLEVARLLIDRAAAERDLERRVTILNRAVAGLTRSAQAAPEDEALSQMLIATRALLWETWERIAMARLAAAMPWNGEILAAEVTPVLVRAR
jgi:hypothetical protein